MEEAVAEYYARVRDKVEEEDFLRAVEDMVVRMNGLCDQATAAQLVASQLGYDEWRKVDQVRLEDRNVMLKGRITRVFGVKEFSRDDGSPGKVANFLLGDETGEIRVAAWDTLADLFAYGEYKEQDTVRLRGHVKPGLGGAPEVNVNATEAMEKTAEEVKVETPQLPIADLKAGMGNVNIRCQVLEVGSPRQFQRRDGSGEGVVRTLQVGDKSGRTRVSLWGEHVQAAEGLQPGDALLLEHAYTREYQGRVDVNLGARGLLKRLDEPVEFQPHYTPIAELGLNSSYTVRGEVSGLGEVREFTRQDGGNGRVGGFYISDGTGRVRVTLWNEKAELLKAISLGQVVEVVDGYARQGSSGEVELSVDWRGEVRPAA